MYEEHITRAAGMIEAGQVEEAKALLGAHLLDEPAPAPALFLLAMCENRLGHPSVAFTLLQAAAAIEPGRAEIWNNLGHCLKETNKNAEARTYFLKALALEPEDPAALANMCAVETALGNHGKALDYAGRCLAVSPGDRDALYNSSLAMLALGQWEEGWKRYAVTLGAPDRTERNYHNDRDTPRWDGFGNNVVVYGEQGIGDEIMFASMIPDVLDRSRGVMIECLPRLEGLFRRSFPEARVFGTRGRQYIDWPARHEIDFRIEMGGLGEFFRPSPESCPKRPYLVPDPEQRLQWRALLDGYPGKKIGIAWTGGSEKTGRSFRSVPLKEWRPILENKHTFISLEYEDRTEEIATFEMATGIRILDWARGTRAHDYDNTAALVAELDLVIAVTTTVVDLCGAMGKECWAMVPQNAPWRYMRDGTYWYDIRTFRQAGSEWGEVVDEIASELRAF